MKRLVIIGAGGHGEVCAEIAEQNGYEEIIFLDNDTQKKECAGYPVKGTLKQASEYSDFDFFIAIGNNQIRKKISRELNKRCVILIHPNTSISRSAVIEGGCVIMANAVVNANTRIKEGCIINTGCTIDHDCNLEPYVHISPGCHLGGTCSVGECSWIGIGSNIINNIAIGTNVMIAAGSIVTKEIPDNVMAAGVPAKVKKERK